MGRLALFAACLLAACAQQPVREGLLPSGETYREYSHQPYGYQRIVYGPDGRERRREELHTEQNFKRIRPGMTKAEVADIIGVGFATTGNYANRTSSATWRYNDGVYKLLHVIYGPDGRVLRYETEWDPNVYSKKK